MPFNKISFMSARRSLTCLLPALLAMSLAQAQQTLTVAAYPAVDDIEAPAQMTRQPH